MQRLAQQLKPGSKAPTGINQVAAETVGTESPVTSTDAPASNVQPPPTPDVASFQANIERMVAAAVERGRGTTNTIPGSRKPSPRRSSSIPSSKFSGCWCCGKSGHSRKDCPVFIEIKRKNGGKVPKDYEGSYEKAKKSGQIRAIMCDDAVTHESDEHPETFMWPVITAKEQIVHPSKPPVSTKNTYAPLSDEDEYDDEHEVVKALAPLTTNVKVQRPKKSKNGLSITQISAIARQESTGKIKLPDLDLDNNDEYECVWALVDSGAGVNVAKGDQFECAEDVEAPPVFLTTANCEHMPNSGAMKVQTMSKEGIVTDRTFYKAPVDMPILAVTELTKEGPQGSTIGFRQNNGFIEDNVTHRRQHFVKRKGVYFMKQYTKRSKSADLGFARPETR